MKVWYEAPGGVSSEPHPLLNITTCQSWTHTSVEEYNDYKCETKQGQQRGRQMDTHLHKDPEWQTNAATLVDEYVEGAVNGRDAVLKRCSL